MGGKRHNFDLSIKSFDCGGLFQLIFMYSCFSSFPFHRFDDITNWKTQYKLAKRKKKPGDKRTKEALQVNMCKCECVNVSV